MLTVVVAFSIMIGEIYHEGQSNMQREIAQEAEYLSLPDAEAHVVHRGEAPEPLRQVLRLNYRLLARDVLIGRYMEASFLAALSGRQRLHVGVLKVDRKSVV